MPLSHVDSEGRARMVDVSAKAETGREARAFGRVRMSPEAYAAVRQGQGPKGDVFTVAKIAGIMGAKKTPDLVPLCHPLPIDFVDVAYTFKDDERVIEIVSTVKVKGSTGVEMEAVTCAMITALTIYDMCKAIDKAIELGPFYLLEKSGGKSGVFKRKQG
ncbi:MAG: cyclic pyranopterin monophosphate synthase MoaC [Syntrophorhabdales bacterium]|jgi:cyclic pyranopterin phosphate synthase